MKRSHFIIAGAAVALVGMGWGVRRVLRRLGLFGGSMFDRVVFVCTDGAGGYSPGVYVHGSPGGGPAAIELLPAAAKHMRSSEFGDAAAGLCGYLFQKLGDDAAAGGALSLLDAPHPGPDGRIDWQKYCAWNVDLVLVNVENGSAECHVTQPPDMKTPSKTMVKTIQGLRFGG